MDRRIFEVLFAQICAIAKNLQPILAPDLDIHRMWYGPRGFFLLAPEDPKRLDKLVRDVLRHADWSQKFSFGFVRDRIKEVIETHAVDAKHKHATT